MVDRVRNATRNSDVIGICDGLERAMAKIAELQSRLLTQQSNAVKPPKFNRRDYMRGYMKRWRADRADPMTMKIIGQTENKPQE